MQQYISQVNSTAQDTQFNGQSILNGSLSNLVFQVGANAGQIISTTGLDVRGQNLGASYGDGLSVNTANLAGASGTLDINNVAVNLNGNNSSVGDVVAAINNVGSQSGVYVQRAGSTQGTVAISGSGSASGTATGTLDLSAYTDYNGNFLNVGSMGFFQINGVNASPDGYVPGTVSQLVSDINTATLATGVTASVSGSNPNSITFTSTTPNSPITMSGYDVFAGINQTYSPGSGGGTITIDGVAVNVAAGATTADVAAAINAYGTQTGVTASAGVSGNLSLTDSTGADINVSGGGGLTVVSGGTISAGIELYTKVGGSIALSGDATTLTDLGLSGSGVDFGALKSLTLNNTNVLTYSGAKDALKAMDFALSQLSSLGGTMGALQSRFQATISNLQAASQNTSAARSRISNADFAAETANLSRAQILQQAGVAMVAQANAQPQLALSLLR